MGTALGLWLWHPAGADTDVAEVSHPEETHMGWEDEENKCSPWNKPAAGLSRAGRGRGKLWEEDVVFAEFSWTQKGMWQQ